MSVRLTTTPHWITMQVPMAGAFMIVDSFGHIRHKLSTIMVRRPPATNTQSLYADRCINMHKEQRSLFGMCDKPGQQASELEYLNRLASGGVFVLARCDGHPARLPTYITDIAPLTADLITESDWTAGLVRSVENDPSWLSGGMR